MPIGSMCSIEHSAPRSSADRAFASGAVRPQRCGPSVYPGAIETELWALMLALAHKPAAAARLASRAGGPPSQKGMDSRGRHRPGICRGQPQVGSAVQVAMGYLDWPPCSRSAHCVSCPSRTRMVASAREISRAGHDCRARSSRFFSATRWMPVNDSRWSPVATASSK